MTAPAPLGWRGTGRPPVRPALRRRPIDEETAAATPAAILAAVAGGVATNRADLARRLGIAPSTVTKKVGDLLRDGVLHEAGGGPATGGRRARVLAPTRGAGHLRAVSVGHRVSRVGVLDLTGSLLAVADVHVDPRDPVGAVLEVLLGAAADLADAVVGGPVRGIGIAVPGPVDRAAGAVDSAAALPGWHRYPLREHVLAAWGVPTVVENDANALAAGEHAVRSRRGDPPQSLLLVKADTALGCGLVLGGRLLRGATSAAGDIAHVRVREAGDELCACGSRGCLELIVGHRGLARALGAAGLVSASPSDTARLVRDGDQRAVAVVAEAAGVLGATLAAVVNFVNPDLLVLGGALATCDVFTLAVDAELRRRCHPLATQALVVERAADGDAELTGIGQLALRAALAAL